MNAKAEGCERVAGYESIEEWASVAGWTLEEALDAGVSQDENEVILVPEYVFSWWARDERPRGTTHPG